MSEPQLLLDLSQASRPEAFRTKTSCHVRAAARQIALGLSGKMLDVACGNGLFLLELWASAGHPLQVYGIDHDRSAVAEARRLFLANAFHSERFIIGDAFRMPFPSNYFAAVFCLNTLINIAPFPRVEALLTEIHRVCRPGGAIIFDYRNAVNPYLALRYCYNKLTHRLTTEGHRAGQFRELKKRLKIEEQTRLVIPSPIPGFPLGYLNIWRK